MSRASFFHARILGPFLHTIFYEHFVNKSFQVLSPVTVTSI